MSEQCDATKLRPTATGEVEVRCTRERGHPGAHRGMTGPFPLSWD